MTNIEIIELWPNVPTLVADIGLPVDKMAMVQRIHKWKMRDYIPGEYWELLLKSSKKRRLGLTVHKLMAAASKRLDCAA